MSLSISEVVNATLGESSGGKAKPEAVIAVAGLALNDYHALVGIGNTIAYNVVVIPANATDKTYSVTISDENILSYDESTQTITALAVGNAQVTFTSTDGGYATVMVVDVVASLIYIETLTINEATKTMYANDQQQLTVSYTPENANETSILWTSSDTTIGTVDANGLVIARALGLFTITAAATVDPNADDDADAVTAIWTSEVIEPPKAVTGVEISVEPTSIISDSTATVTVTVLPEDAADKTYKLSVSGNGDLTVNQSTGVLTPSIDADGTYTITVVTTDGSYSDSVDLTVVAYQQVQAVTLPSDTIQLYPGKTAQLEPTVSPSDASHPELTYSSDNEAVATVNDTGLVTAIAIGDVTFTATSVDNSAATATQSASVIADPNVLTGILLSGANVGGSDGSYVLSNVPADSATEVVVTLSAQPNTATLESVTATVESGSAYIYSMNLDKGVGTLTLVGKDEGDASIILTDGNVTSSLAVHVVQQEIDVTGVDIEGDDPVEVSLSAGTIQLKAQVLPENASNQNVTWSSSDTTIATVSASGTVTFNNVGGTVDITVKTAQGGFTDTVRINITDDVNIPLTGLTFTESPSSTMDWNDDDVTTYQMNIVLTPSDTTTPDVTYASSETDVATVNSTGLVTIVGLGTTDITATSVSNTSIVGTAAMTVVDKRAVSVTTPHISDLVLVPGLTAQLTLEKSPSDGTVTGTWTSTDETVVTIDETGLLTAVAAGSFGIGWSGTDGAGNSVSDSSSGGNVEDISVATDSFSDDLVVGSTVQLVWTVTPAGIDQVEGYTQSFITDTPSVATIDDTGLVTGVAAGDARVGIQVSAGTSSDSDDSHIGVVSS